MRILCDINNGTLIRILGNRGRLGKPEHGFEDGGCFEEDVALDAEVYMVGTPDDEIRTGFIEGKRCEPGLKRL